MGTVGASVTARLRFSTRLSALGTDSFISAYCVACLADFLSAASVLPFVSLKGMPRHSGPWLAAACLLPSATLMVASRVIGQCLVQLMLQFAMLLSAFAVDLFLEGQHPSRMAVTGALMVLAGVFLVGSSGKPASGSSASLSSAALGSLAAMASGLGFVLSARFCMPRHGDEANSVAFVSLVASASFVFPAVVASWYYATGFHVRFEDLHLWILGGVQGLFYTRSFQILPKQISYAATFTLSLASQLVTAALVDLKTGPFSHVTGTVGLTFVFLGVALRELSPK